MIDSAATLVALDTLHSRLSTEVKSDEAELVLRAMTLINMQARELRMLRAHKKKLRNAAKPFIVPDWCEAASFSGTYLRALAAAYAETRDE